jgi:hypothetical protein
VVVPDDAEKLKSPEYAAVIVSLPAGASFATQLADPETRPGVVHRAVEPLTKLTVPVGLPDPDVTVVEYVTDEPKVVDVGLTVTDVVDWKVTATGALPTEPAWVESPEYVAYTLPVPTGALLALQLAEPETKDAVHSVLGPTVKLTVPVGVPDPDWGATVAE